MINQFDAGFGVDMNMDGDQDFFLVWGFYFGGSNFFEINGGETNTIDATFNGSANLVDMIPAGGTIPTDYTPKGFAAFSGFVGSRGYVAVQFAASPNFFTPEHYGYLDVEVNGDNNTLTLYGGAYESTANTPIQTPAVPEPGSLAALAFGGIVAASLRRRKKVITG